MGGGGGSVGGSGLGSFFCDGGGEMPSDYNTRI